MNSDSRRTHCLAALLALLATFALGLPACDGSKVVRHGPNNGADGGANNGANNGSNNGGNNGANNGTGQLTESGTDDAGHGPDEDQELIEAGFMTGSWRVGNAEDQALIANFDLIQEAQSASVEGNYTMGNAVYDRLDGVSGEVSAESSFSADTLTLKWNPTDVPNEMYTITAQKVDDDTFTGRLSAIDYVQLDREVRITRYHFGGAAPDDDDGTTAGDIDAGPQGGAGGSQTDAGL
jgi:hypothetical protein